MISSQKFSLLAAVVLPVFINNSVLAQPANGTESAHQHEEQSQSNQHKHSDDHSHQKEKATSEEHGDHGDESSDGDIGEHTDEHSEKVELSFSAKQMQLANISITQLAPRIMQQNLYAPGEIQANGYTSYFVSPRVESVIVKRHAILGEHVEKNQPLVTLFSEAVADAQAAYRIAYADWQRAKNVGKNVISESQLLSAQTDHIAAFSRLRAYGLTEQAIKTIIKDTSSILGEYTLRAERSGAVLSDDFHQGQRVSAGDAIMVLTDETELWLEARLAATNQMALAKGTLAQVVLAGNDSEDIYTAEVIQESHTIDAKTRTRVVRLKVNNDNHQLHPGLFVDVYFALSSKKPVLVVPEAALLRGSDGDWLVYTQKEHQEPESTEHLHDEAQEHEQEKVVFAAQEVELGQLYRTFSKKTNQWLSWREISGIEENSKVAITGAFFIASQSAKGGFDPHNH